MNILVVGAGAVGGYYGAHLVRAGHALAENADLGGNYTKGTCPVADSLFERSIILAIPSCLTTEDEDDIIHAFEKVLRALL